MPASEEPTCGKWMPRARDYCARGPGHAPPCHSPARMEKQRVGRRARVREDAPEAKARWRRTHHLKRYGLTTEKFVQLLEAQGRACGMCRVPFEAGQKICVDHDHACCPGEKASCGRCVRGLLCNDCNTALGQIERKYEMARGYLDSPPGRAGPVRLVGLCRKRGPLAQSGSAPP